MKLVSILRKLCTWKNVNYQIWYVEVFHLTKDILHRRRQEIEYLTNESDNVSVYSCVSSVGCLPVTHTHTHTHTLIPHPPLSVPVTPLLLLLCRCVFPSGGPEVKLSPACVSAQVSSSQDP